MHDEPEIQPSTDDKSWELLKPTLPGEHVWTAMAVYRISAAQASVVAGDPDGSDPTTQVRLDRDNRVNVMVGCFICEEPFSRQLSYRKCKGEPDG